VATDKQRREAERRRLQRQAERRRQQSTQRRRTNVIASVVGVLVLVAVVVTLLVVTNGDSDDKPTDSAGACTWTKSGTAAKKVTVPKTTNPPKTGTVDVSVRTTRGTMGFALDRAKAPCAVASFLSLASQKYFDATACHRLTTGPSLFVLQCGDPTGSGSGGPGYSFADELTGKETYTQGVLAMANAGVDTNGSQFFIVYKASQLDPKYTVFGSVTSGLDVVTKVAAGGVAANGTAPKMPIGLASLRVAK
jgi:peptidyl-prolyl cis-trans isomerase B (cyclophilin B)